MPATDEIYERYLQKAIVEINDLAHEVAQAGGDRVPVVGSGHPLADVMLLKYKPQAAEVQEGVAFYGRAGQAVLKSLQRQHQPHEPEARRHHDERDERDVPPRRGAPQTVVERVVEGERREES